MRVSQLFNTLFFTQQEEEQEQEVRVSQLFNTLLFTQQEEGCAVATLNRSTTPRAKLSVQPSLTSKILLQKTVLSNSIYILYE